MSAFLHLVIALLVGVMLIAALGSLVMQRQPRSVWAKLFAGSDAGGLAWTATFTGGLATGLAGWLALSAAGFSLTPVGRQLVIGGLVLAGTALLGYIAWVCWRAVTSPDHPDERRAALHGLGAAGMLWLGVSAIYTGNAIWHGQVLLATLYAASLWVATRSLLLIGRQLARLG